MQICSSSGFRQLARGSRQDAESKGGIAARESAKQLHAVLKGHESDSSGEEWSDVLDVGAGSTSTSPGGGKRVKNDPEAVETAKGKTEKIWADTNSVSIRLKKTMAWVRLHSEDPQAKVLSAKLATAQDELKAMVQSYEDQLIGEADWAFVDLAKLKVDAGKNVSRVSTWVTRMKAHGM